MNALLPAVQPQAKFAARLPRHARVLDVGCGDFSRIHRYVGARRPDVEIEGIERFEDASIYGPIGASPTRAIPYRRLACNIENERFPYPDAVFDGIYFAHVIEHLEEKLHVLGEIARVTRPGGFVYVETPGPIAARIDRPRWIDPKLGGTVRYDDDPTHLGLPMDIAQLRSRVSSVGLSVRSSGSVRELGLPGLPLYAGMALAGMVPALRFETRSFLYGAGYRNLVGWAIYVLAVK